jgi:hypothetical protein
MELFALGVGIPALTIALVWFVKIRKKNRPTEVVDPEREMAIRDSLRRQRSENPRDREHMNVNQNQYLGPGV